jgi:hypothetical protein
VTVPHRERYCVADFGVVLCGESTVVSGIELDVAGLSLALTGIATVQV